MQIIELLLEYVDRDPYGNEHGVRVKMLAMRLAEKSGVAHDSKAMRDIEYGALFHDIGKGKIPENVLQVQGKYTQSQYEMMKFHPIYSAQILAKAVNGVISVEVVMIAKHHHEEYKGTGYPSGLVGINIPFGARVVAICDEFDAITHNRGYEFAKSKMDSLAEMEQEQIEKEKFDPRLFGLFIEMIKGR